MWVRSCSVQCCVAVCGVVFEEQTHLLCPLQVNEVWSRSDAFSPPMIFLPLCCVGNVVADVVVIDVVVFEDSRHNTSWTVNSPMPTVLYVNQINVLSVLKRSSYIELIYEINIYTSLY